MAVLFDVSTGRNMYLGAEQEIGRSDRCGVRVTSSLASAIHASLRWIEGWELKDLGSKNGTFVGELRLEPQQWVPLHEGASLAFGDPEQRFELRHARAPSPVLFPLRGGDPIDIAASAWALPSADEPQATVMRSARGGWQIELADALIPLTDGSEIEVAGVRYRFVLPEMRTTTPTSSVALPMHLRDATLCLAVSKDEEHVETELRGPSGHFVVPSRSHHYMLVLLARKRQEDAALPESSRGWMHRDELAGMLKTNVPKLNVDIFRIREQFAALPLQGAAEIIERRQRAGQLRLGISKLALSAL